MTVASNVLAAVLLFGIALVSATNDYVAQNKPFGWLGPLVIAVVGAFALWRAGSVKAWKETANGRLQRIEDLSSEVADLRAELAGVEAELKIPERIQGIIELMVATAERQDANATERLEHGLTEIRTYVDARFERHEAVAADRYEAQIDVLRELAETQRETARLLRTVRRDQVSDEPGGDV